MHNINKGDGQDSALAWSGKASLLLASTLALLATGIVSPAMPDIAVAFQASLEGEKVPRSLISFISLFSDQVGIDFLIKFFVLSVPALFIVLGAPLMGICCDMWGRKRVLVVSLIGFAIAGTSGFLVDTLTALLLGRAVLGASIAGIKSSTVALIGDFMEGEERQRFLGLQGAAMKFGGVVFLLLGGLLADISWRTPFLVYLLAFVALPGVILYLHEVHGAREVPVQGISLPRLSTAMVLITTFLASGFYFMILVQMPFFLDQAFSASRFQIGMALATPNLIAALVATRFYLFKARFSYHAIFSWVFLMMGIGFGLVSVSGSYTMVLAALALAGLGVGLIVPGQDSWILSIAPPARRGMAIGLVATVMYLGQFMAPVLLQPFILPENPFYPFRIASGVLIVLAIEYLLFVVGPISRKK